MLFNKEAVIGDRSHSGSNSVLALAVLGLLIAVMAVAWTLFASGIGGQRGPQRGISALSLPDLPRMPDPTPMPLPTPRPG